MKVKETIQKIKETIKNHKILSCFIIVTIIAILVAIVMVEFAKNFSSNISSPGGENFSVNEGEKCTRNSPFLYCGGNLSCFVPLKNATAEFGICVNRSNTTAIATYCKNSTDGPSCNNGTSCQFIDDEYGMTAKCVKI